MLARSAHLVPTRQPSAHDSSSPWRTLKGNIIVLGAGRECPCARSWHAGRECPCCTAGHTREEHVSPKAVPSPSTPAQRDGHSPETPKRPPGFPVRTGSGETSALFISMSKPQESSEQSPGLRTSASVSLPGVPSLLSAPWVSPSLAWAHHGLQKAVY